MGPEGLNLSWGVLVVIIDGVSAQRPQDDVSLFSKGLLENDSAQKVSFLEHAISP